MKQIRVTSTIAIFALLLFISCGVKKITNSPVPPETITITSSHCDVAFYDFDTDFDSLSNPITWTTDIGTIDSSGRWSYAPTLADVGVMIPVTITATDSLRNNFTAIIEMNLTNEVPLFYHFYHPFNVRAGVPTVVQLGVTDDCDPVYFSVVSGPATVDSLSGLLTIDAPENIDLQTIVVQASDLKDSSRYEFEILVQTGSLFKIEIPEIGDSNEQVLQGQHVKVPVNLISGNMIDGYDLLIGFDNTALSFQSATPGTDLVDDDWEYFTYRYIPTVDCNNCPSALIRLTAIAETNNGPNHPIIDGVNELAVLDFLVTNDRSLECQEIPIRFFWVDCGDNTLSSEQGYELHISEVVFDGDELMFPPNGIEIQDSLFGFPTYFGTQEECYVPVVGKPTPIRDVSFNNGSVTIACADAIDSRGDLNLNFVANEIADAVLYANYFIYGIGQFNINTEGQIAASDVNADGLALSVADLAYLIRIIAGDALSDIPSVDATLTSSNGTLNINAEMGAVLIVINGEITADLLATNMSMISSFDGVNTRILIYSLEGNIFSGDFIKVLGTIVSIEFGSAQGATVSVQL